MKQSGSAMSWGREVVPSAFVCAVGAIAGAALALDTLAFTQVGAKMPQRQLIEFLLAGAVCGAVFSLALRIATVFASGRFGISEAARRRFLRRELLSYLLLLLVGLGALGVNFGIGAVGCVIAAILVVKTLLLLAAFPAERRRSLFTSLPYLALLFFVSGFAALIYQIVWQRVLFANYGVNIESITIVVSLFMFGLGVGSIVGGGLSRAFPARGPALFLGCELLMGLFGVFSLSLMHWVSSVTLYGSIAEVSAAIYALLCIPTILMGATLPILVAHLNRHYRNVGKSVGMLYCINTLGSAAACFATAEVLFVYSGLQTSVIVAALCNFTAGVLVYRYARRIAAAAGVDAFEPRTAEAAA